MPGANVYSAGKPPLISLTRTLSDELISRSIRVQCQRQPGRESALRQALGLFEEQLKATSESLQQQIPAGRFGSPAESRVR